MKLYVFILLPLLLFSQHTDYKNTRSNATYLQLGGPEILGIHLNSYLQQNISLNFGLGLNFDLHIGSNVYIRGRDASSTSIYGGLQFISYNKFSLFGSAGGRQFGIYIPIGYEYFAANGFSLQLDIGPNFVKKDWGQRNTKPFLGSFRAGLAF